MENYKSIFHKLNLSYENNIILYHKLDCFMVYIIFWNYLNLENMNYLCLSFFTSKDVSKDKNPSFHRKMNRSDKSLLSIKRLIEVINPFLYLNVVLKDKVLYFLYTLKVVQGLETTLMPLHALIDTWKRCQYL